MLGRSYSEGAKLSSIAPKDIPLPDDDAKALEIIFNVIHYRMEAIDDPLDPSVVLCRYGGSYVKLGEVDRMSPGVVGQYAGKSSLFTSTLWLVY